MSMKEIKAKKQTILHITPHLGGGVGSVLLNYFAKAQELSDFRHDVLCLDYANEKACLASKAAGFDLADKMSFDHERILNKISSADVVLIHWWNHPLLSAFLVRETLPPARIIFWSHISGFHAPYVFNKPALYYPDLFVFTSPLSRNVPEVRQLPDERQKDFRVIWSTGGIERTAAVRTKPHSGFNVGYIGTVDYGKMHSRFLKMSSNVAIPDVHFIVCGGPNEKQIQEEAKQYGGDNRFTFTGKINNINKYLEIFDVFGYPLDPDHYGTCEQSLGECMAAGIPPVVLANRTESLIVENGVAGIVAANEEKYSQAIEELCRNSELRQELSCNARKTAQKQYSSDLMISRWENVFDEVLNFPKTGRWWTGKYHGKGVSAADIFLESLGNHGKEFLCSLNAITDNEKQAAAEGIKRLYGSAPLWNSKTRGTPQHYYSFFQEDLWLKTWSFCRRSTSSNTCGVL